MKKFFINFLLTLSLIIPTVSSASNENNINKILDVFSIILEEPEIISETDIILKARLDYNDGASEDDFTRLFTTLYDDNDNTIFFEYKEKTAEDWNVLEITKETAVEAAALLEADNFSFLNIEKILSDLDEGVEYEYRLKIIIDGEEKIFSGDDFATTFEPGVDLRLKKIEFNPENIADYTIGSGFGIKVIVTAKATGLDDETLIPIIVKVTDNENNFVDSCYEQNVVESRKITWSCYINDISKAGEYTFKAEIDFGNKIKEEDEDNNIKEETVNVATNSAEDTDEYNLKQNKINSFETCQDAHYLIFSVNPRKCLFNGKVYEEGAPNEFDGVQCSAEQLLTQNLRAGDRNGKYSSWAKKSITEVKILQAHMNRLGFNAGPVDGILGPLTDGAIKRMQKFLGTTQDGMVGPITRKLLNNSCDKEEEDKEENQTESPELDVTKLEVSNLTSLIEEIKTTEDQEEKNNLLAEILQMILNTKK